jgi:pimeloyl-ACP methyl ester carboxylesterase
LHRALREAGTETWDAWDSIRCPTLIVGGERGLDGAGAHATAARLRDVDVETIADARLDDHLERPEEWRRVAERFLGQIAASNGGWGADPGS